MNQKKILNKLDLYTMLRVTPKETGLPMNIFIYPGTCYEGGPHISISNNYGKKLRNDIDFFLVTLEGSVKGDVGEITQEDMQKILKFITLNTHALTQLWEDQICPFETVLLLEKV